MKSFLIATVFVAFAITVIDSLKCKQCQPFNTTCVIQECEEGSMSCKESLVNSTLGGSFYSYQNKFCSKENCTDNKNTEVAFTVHVFDDQSFHFASQCCQEEACNDTKYDPGQQTPSNTQCPACYGYNTTCSEKTLKCFQGEQCVHIIAEFVNGTERNKVELKGCSNISNSICQTLSPGNMKVGEFLFQKVQCTVAREPSTTSSPTTSTGIRVSFTSSVFGSLLLLKLLI